MTNNKNNQGPAPSGRGLFSTRQGRALSPLRKRMMDEVYPKLEIPTKLLTENHDLSPNDLYEERLVSHWLEIGFGYGEHMAALAKDNPDIGYIGVEPFTQGMATFCVEVKDQPLHNMRVVMDDGMIVARSLQEDSLDGIYILNPDPWHKKRHHKRRIVNQKNLDTFAKIIKPGGDLIMTTDVPDLAEWMCIQASNYPDFVWSANNRNDFFNAPDDWIPTRYETKGAKGAKKMVYLFFKRV